MQGIRRQPGAAAAAPAATGPSALAVRLQQWAVIVLIGVQALAYWRAAAIPFAIPLSLMHGPEPGGWAYAATLLGLGGILALAGWDAVLRRDRFAVLMLVLAGALVVLLGCYPWPSAPHEPLAMTLAVLGELWLFSKVEGTASTWRTAGPWVGLCGLPLLATGRNLPAAIGEGLLMLALAIAAGAIPGPPRPGAGWALASRLAPVLRTPGLAWGLACLLGTHVSGALGQDWLLPVLVLATAWACGWAARRWDPGIILSIVLRLAPVMLLVHAFGSAGALFIAFAVLAVGAMLMWRMTLILAE